MSKFSCSHLFLRPVCLTDRENTQDPFNQDVNYLVYAADCSLHQQMAKLASAIYRVLVEPQTQRNHTTAVIVDCFALEETKADSTHQFKLESPLAKCGYQRRLCAPLSSVIDLAKATQNLHRAFPKSQTVLLLDRTHSKKWDNANMTVINAVYGSQQSTSHMISVLSMWEWIDKSSNNTLRLRIPRGRCFNTIFGCDPCPGLPKSLYLTVQMDGLNLVGEDSKQPHAHPSSFKFDLQFSERDGNGYLLSLSDIFNRFVWSQQNNHPVETQSTFFMPKIMKCLVDAAINLTHKPNDSTNSSMLTTLNQLMDQDRERVVYLIYQETTTWESDYIEIELLSELKSIKIHRINVKHPSIAVIIDAASHQNIPVNQIYGNCVVAFTCNTTALDTILNVVNKLRPLVVFQLSDEYGQHQQMVQQLQCKTPLLLKQYNHPQMKLDQYPNVFQIPLGYQAGMFNQKRAVSLSSEIKSMADRSLLWSFVGSALRPERQRMIGLFQKEFPGDRSVTKDGINSRQMFDIYNDSLFVISGRGNSTLDCFRQYEAAFSGAIPIVVGPMEEIRQTFWFRGRVPPFLFVDTWEGAVAQVKRLRPDLIQLQKMQCEIREWMNQEIEKVRSQISDVLQLNWMS